MKIHSVAVLGAGAVGSYVIWGLSEKKDISLSVIAKGERAERLKAEGCLINGKTYYPEVLTPEEAKGVDENDVRICEVSHRLVARRQQDVDHHVQIDLILRAAKGNTRNFHMG